MSRLILTPGYGDRNSLKTGQFWGNLEDLQGVIRACDANFGELYAQFYQGSVFLTSYAQQIGLTVDTTGTVACDAVINAAIAYCIANKVRLILPSGILLLNNPLLLDAGGTFNSLWMEGQGGIGTAGPTPYSSWKAAGYSACTLFVANFNNQPAMYQCAARATVLRNFAILGPNLAPNSVTIPQVAQSSYVTSGCRTDRYSPCCAIALDANNVTTPSGGGYPNMTYNVNPGEGSAQGLFENISISNFVVAIAFGTSGGSYNTDDFRLNNIIISYCDTAYAVGHAQAKNISVTGGDVTNCRQLVDGVNYGAQQGCPITFRSVNIGSVYRIMNYQASFGNALFDDCYGEANMCWGNFGTGGSSNRYHLTIDCKGMQFGASGWVMPPIHLEANGPVTCNGAHFVNATSAANGGDVWNIFSTAGVALNDCMFFAPASGLPIPHVGICIDAQNSTARMRDCWIGGLGVQYSDDYPRAFGVSKYTTKAGRLNATYQTHVVPNGNADLVFLPGTSSPQIGIGGCSAFVIDGTTGNLTFTCTNAVDLQIGDYLLWLILPQGGSNTQWVAPSFQISNIVSTAITAVPVWDHTQNDTVANYNASYSGFALVVPYQQWAPTQTLTCTTNGTTAISAITAPHAILPGDWVYASNFPSNTRVVSVNVGASTAVLNQSASSSASNVAMYFGRLYSPTLTAAW